MNADEAQFLKLVAVMLLMGQIVNMILLVILVALTS